jgi:hypothetical protein
MSRLTFRKPAGEVAWQKQLRDRYVSEGVPPVPHLSVKRAIVKPVTRKMAKQIILRYEWLGKMSNTSLHYGIFFGLHCAGVACVGYGASMAGAHHHEQFGISRDDMLTLARGACVHWAPPLTNSRLISWTCKLLQRNNTGKLIWATADSDAGEIGTIYQACNWVCVGLSSSVARQDNEVIAPNGRAYNRRSIGGWAQKQGIRFVEMKEALLSNGWTFQPGNPKHRYAYVLDKKDSALVRRVESMRQPYPKRLDPRPPDGSAPASSRGSGGSTPTRTL